MDNPIRDIFLEGRGEGGNPIYPELVKVDDYTVRWNLHQPNGSFLDTIFNLWLIPRHKWEAVWRAGNFNDTMKTTDDPNDVVSLGPFRLKEYVTGQRVVLERNPYFWKVDKKGQRLPYLDRLIFIIARDSNTIQAKFRAGELDMMSRVRAEDFAIVKRLESSEVSVQDIGQSLDTQWVVFNQNTGNNPNTGKPFVDKWKQRLFRDVKFRQAVSYAIDREGLANTVYAGRAEPLYSFVTPGDKYWYTDDVMKYLHDPARSRQMLAELGLKDTNGDGFLEDSEGHTLEFTFNTNSENSQHIRTTPFLAQNLKDVGIKVNSNVVALTTIVEMMQSVFNFDAIVLGWGTGVPTGPTNSKNIILSSGLNHACFPNQQHPSTEWEARADKLMYEIESTVDANERKQKYAEVQRIWAEQLPEINLVTERAAVAYKSKFGNMLPSPMPPRVSWNAEEIYIKK